MNRALLTPKEAAETLNIGKTKLFELLRSGELPRVSFGSAVRIPASAIDDLIQRRIDENRSRESA